MSIGQVPETATGQAASLEDGDASAPLSSIDLRLRKMGVKGWSLRFEVGSDGDVTVSGYAGDSNCPHQKEYDQRDGHGTSSFDCTDNMWYDRAQQKCENNGKPTEFYSFEEALAYAESEIAMIVPGGPWPKREPRIVIAASALKKKSWWQRIRAAFQSSGANRE